MDGLIFLAMAPVLALLFWWLIRWSERRDARAAVREIDMLRRASADRGLK